MATWLARLILGVPVIIGSVAAQVKPGATTPAKVEGEVLVITQTAVIPKQISRPSGPFLLVILNHSDSKGLLVQVSPHTSATGNVGPTSTVAIPVQANMDDVGGSFHTLVDLPSGAYDFVVPGYPNLQATITIK